MAPLLIIQIMRFPLFSFGYPPNIPCSRYRETITNEQKPLRNSITRCSLKGTRGAAKKLRSISQLLKIWRFAGSPPYEISGLYLNMLWHPR
jgi:hypothetical protein